MVERKSAPFSFWFTIALDAVVFPIPISPSAMRSAPSAMRLSTTDRPTTMAASASSRVIAGSAEKSRVPAATRAARNEIRGSATAPGVIGSEVLVLERPVRDELVGHLEPAL